MAGGAGNDAYIVDNSGDKVSEQGNGGTDTIYTSLASFDLGSAANVQNLVFTGTAGFTGKASNNASTLIGAARRRQSPGRQRQRRLGGARWQ